MVKVDTVPQACADFFTGDLYSLGSPRNYKYSVSMHCLCAKSILVLILTEGMLVKLQHRPDWTIRRIHWIKVYFAILASKPVNTSQTRNNLEIH